MGRSAVLNRQTDSMPKVDAGSMLPEVTAEQIHEKLARGYEEYRAGRVHDAAEVFRQFAESHWQKTGQNFTAQN